MRLIKHDVVKWSSDTFIDIGIVLEDPVGELDVIVMWSCGMIMSIKPRLLKKV